MIAVDQDPLGKQGRRVFQLKGSQCGAHDVWARPLANGDTAVVLWNRGVCGTHSLLGFDWPTVGVADASRRMGVRDLFEQRDLGVHAGSFSGFVDLRFPSQNQMGHLGIRRLFQRLKGLLTRNGF